MANKQKVVRWLSIGIGIYALLGICFYALQEKILFNPTVIAADSSYGFTEPHQELMLPVDANSQIHLVQFQATGIMQKGVVLYFHGNKGNIRRYKRFVSKFTKNGYAVWMPDYPGYGKSTGELSEQALYDLALQVYKLARQYYQPQEIIIYGKSLGTGIAAELAAVRDCQQLILETPYYSMRSLIGLYLWMYPLQQMLHYHFPTNEYLMKVTAPVTIFHGTADGVIPYRNASRLKQVLKPTDRFITIEGGSHRNLNGYKVMQTVLDSLLQNKVMPHKN